MKFLSANGSEILKKDCSPTVLAMYDNSGNRLDTYIEYHNVSVDILKKLGAVKVRLFTNHAGNDSLTQSHFVSHSTLCKIASINRQLL